MREDLINDDRDDAAHTIRSKLERRKSKTLFHLQTPFMDSGGAWVTEDRRSGLDRREQKAA